MREPRDRNTGLQTTDHYSWREVYAAQDVDTGGHEDDNGGDSVG